MCTVDELRENLHGYAFEAGMTGRCFPLTDTEYAIKPKPSILEHEPDCESVICFKIDGYAGYEANNGSRVR